MTNPDLDPDIPFMEEALKEARAAFALDEVPVGAVVVCGGKIVARAHNLVESARDATAHAERLALSRASEALGRWRLTGATLYCTLEPCAMCAGALLSARVDRVVWGAKDIRLGANGSWIDLFAIKHPMHSLEVRSGVLAAESAALMQSFFARKR